MFCLESNKIKKFTVGGVVCVAGGMEQIWAAIFAQDKSTMNLLYGDGFALVLAGLIVVWLWGRSGFIRTIPQRFNSSQVALLMCPRNWFGLRLGLGESTTRSEFSTADNRG